MKLNRLVTILGLFTASCTFGGTDGSPECESYCDDMEESCPATFESGGDFNRDACIAACSGYEDVPQLDDDGNVIPLGNPVPNSDTLQCRVYHAKNAGGDRDGIHCGHAGPTGANTCVDFVPPCKDYCVGTGADFLGVVEACVNTEFAFASVDDCAAFCNGLSRGEEGERDGNTAQCRLTWAMEISSDPQDPALCENATRNSPVCVRR